MQGFPKFGLIKLVKKAYNSVIAIRALSVTLMSTSGRPRYLIQLNFLHFLCYYCIFLLCCFCNQMHFWQWSEAKHPCSLVFLVVKLQAPPFPSSYYLLLHVRSASIPPPPKIQRYRGEHPCNS
uniref:Uncharacterized protein n=1 Tax=Opuntia streptacantha TaxID=393608 RepID=A0A7C9CZS7_OPUST